MGNKDPEKGGFGPYFTQQGISHTMDALTPHLLPTVRALHLPILCVHSMEFCV